MQVSANPSSPRLGIRLCRVGKSRARLGLVCAIQGEYILSRVDQQTYDFKLSKSFLGNKYEECT